MGYRERRRRQRQARKALKNRRAQPEGVGAPRLAGAVMSAAGLALIGVSIMAALTQTAQAARGWPAGISMGLLCLLIGVLFWRSER